jgi:hypothetical protein
MSERAHGFAAGAILGCLVALLLLSLILGLGCRKDDTRPTWTPVEAGKWVVVPPERSFVVVEIKLDPGNDRFYMRISSVAFPRPAPPEDNSARFAMVTSRKVELDPKKALDKTVGWIDATDDVPALHAWWTHECCDCGSTHRVLSIPTPDGLRMLWWKDEIATRKKRLMRGLEPAPSWIDPWSPGER